MRELTELQKRALALAEAGHGPTEIAALLGIRSKGARATAANILRRARNALRRQELDALRDKSYDQKLAEEDKENNRPKKRKSFEGSYDQRLDARFPIFRQAREQLRTAGYSDDAIDQLRKSGWDAIQMALSEIVSRPKEVAQRTKSDEGKYSERYRELLREGFDEYESRRVCDLEFNPVVRVESKSRSLDVTVIPQPPEVPPPNVLDSADPRFFSPGYGMRISNSPRPEDLRRVDTWHAPEPVHVKFLETEFEAPIISELRRMSPQERALKMDDPDFVSRLKAHRDLLW